MRGNSPCPRPGYSPAASSSDNSTCTASTVAKALSEPTKLQVYVKNTFLEVKEEHDDSDHQEVGGHMQQLWRSMKQKTRANRSQSQPSKVLGGYSGAGSGMSESGSERSSGSSCNPQVALHNSSAVRSASRDARSERSEATPDSDGEQLEASVADERGAPAVTDAPSSVAVDDSSARRRNRQRPNKVTRERGRQLAEMLFNADTDEAREVAEEVFLNETTECEALYEYAMAVLRKMRLRAREGAPRDADPRPTQLIQHL